MNHCRTRHGDACFAIFMNGMFVSLQTKVVAKVISSLSLLAKTVSIWGVWLFKVVSMASASSLSVGIVPASIL